jgi:hypothetical protein
MKSVVRKSHALTATLCALSFLCANEEQESNLILLVKEHGRGRQNLERLYTKWTWSRPSDLPSNVTSSRTNELNRSAQSCAEYRLDELLPCDIYRPVTSLPHHREGF